MYDVVRVNSRGKETLFMYFQTRDAHLHQSGSGASLSLHILVLFLYTTKHVLSGTLHTTGEKYGDLYIQHLALVKIGSLVGAHSRLAY